MAYLGCACADQDRLLATELGKPMLINDDECDTEYPDMLEDERSMFDASSPASNPPPSVLLLANIHVARLLAPLAKLFRLTLYYKRYIIQV